jgi:hypothetical protein
MGRRSRRATRRLLRDRPNHVQPSELALTFAGKRLIVRFGPVADLGMKPSLFAYTTIGNQRLSPTECVHDLLFEPV